MERAGVSVRGTLIVDLVLGAARSLKDRRGPQRTLVQKLRNLDYAVAQVGPADRFGWSGATSGRGRGR